MGETVMPYPLSTDYDELYARICAGEVVAAFVDHTYQDEPDCPVWRDVCSVRRKGPWQITIGVRGHTYSQICQFEERHCNGRSEKEIFMIDCKLLNLGWVKPAEAE
jgi:hypothetical protein